MHKIFKFLINLSRKRSEISTDISEISWNFLKFPLISVKYLEIFLKFHRYRWNFLKFLKFSLISVRFFEILKFPPISVRIVEIFWNFHRYRWEILKFFEIPPNSVRHLEILPKPVKFQEISLKLMKFHVFHRVEFGVYEWCLKCTSRGFSYCQATAGWKVCEIL